MGQLNLDAISNAVTAIAAAWLVYLATTVLKGNFIKEYKSHTDSRKTFHKALRNAYAKFINNNQERNAVPDLDVRLRAAGVPYTFAPAPGQQVWLWFENHFKGTLKVHSKVVWDFVQAIYPDNCDKLMSDTEFQEFDKARNELSTFWNVSWFSLLTRWFAEMYRWNMPEVAMLTYLEIALTKKTKGFPESKMGLYRLGLKWGRRVQN